MHRQRMPSVADADRTSLTGWPRERQSSAENPYAVWNATPPIIMNALTRRARCRFLARGGRDLNVP